MKLTPGGFTDITQGHALVLQFVRTVSIR
jgi:hypothetical protein